MLPSGDHVGNACWPRSPPVTSCVSVPFNKSMENRFVANSSGADGTTSRLSVALKYALENAAAMVNDDASLVLAVAFNHGGFRPLLAVNKPMDMLLPVAPIMKLTAIVEPSGLMLWQPAQKPPGVGMDAAGLPGSKTRTPSSDVFQ